MLTIYFTKEDIFERCEWPPDSYTDYEFMTSIFVVKNGEQWVGIYPMSYVHHIDVGARG